MTIYDVWHFKMVRGSFGPPTLTPDRRRSSPLAKYDLTVASDGEGYCEPALRQESPTCAGTLLILLVLTSVPCSFTEAGNAYAQSTFAAATTLTRDVQVQSTPTVIRSTESPAYPLKASANNRYLVDQNDVPFLMVGDSPQALIGNLSLMEATLFIENRRRYGINALWINLLCNDGTGCNADGTTFDGVAPFTTANDLSTPNSVYFDRAAVIINLAAANGMIVILNPIETIGWLRTLQANGIDKTFAYGQYLGNRYKNFPNIIWMHGNDLQSWQEATDDALVQAVARGIRSVDSNHIHTVELNYTTSGSLEDASWAPLIELNAAYTYFPTYAQILTEYNRSNFKPVFMVEANYEFEHGPGTDGGSTQNLRRQEYWTMLSGATGQLYGSAHTWRLSKGWESNLDTPGVTQLSYMKNLFVSIKWYDLIPDQTHSVVTAGYDSFSCLAGKVVAYVGKDPHPNLMARALARLRKYWAIGSITANTCATAARTSDGSLVMAYMPTIRTITVDMSKLASVATARWYDPTNGEYANINGSPFANTGSRKFTPPGNNSSGDGDWVLMLETSASR